MSSMKSRFSILRLMIVISVVAAECGLLRSAWETSYFATVLMILPTLTVMLLGLPKLRRGHASRFFWIGFDVAGLGLVALVFFMQWIAYETFIYPVFLLYGEGWIGTSDAPKDYAVTWTFIFAIYTTPQLLVASIVGWFSARYRVVIQPRPSLSHEGSTSTGPSIVCEASYPLVTSPAFGEGTSPAVNR